MNKQNTGQLFAVGVGTGDSELLTLKALRLLREADVIAIPEKNLGKADSFAWEIVSGALQQEQLTAQRCFLHFPMTRNPAINVPAWQNAAQKIAGFIRAGKRVVFISEGDPSVFSTWAYLQEELNDLLPEFEPEIVPGITSITAIPAQTKIPLADGQERFCVVPATYGMECLPRLVEEFDTIMLIKAGRVIPQLILLLEELGVLGCASYVSHATTDKQEIYSDLRDVPNEHRYFSMVQLSLRGRRGILRGNLPCTEHLVQTEVCQ